MKKILLIFASLSLLAVFIGCNEDDETPQEFPVVGTWMPVKEVRTTVDLDGVGVSDEITYTTCQQESRWVFNDTATGKRTDKDMAGSPAICSTISTRNFTYNYNKSDKSFEIKYQGTIVSDKGKVVDLNGETLNLKIEDHTDPDLYKSTTYTFKRVAL